MNDTPLLPGSTHRSDEDQPSVIHLSAEVVSGLGEDTFWTWFHRECSLPTRFGIPTHPGQHDRILQYSTLGACPHPDHSIALLWELHPEMKLQLKSDEWDPIIQRIEACGRSARRRVVTSRIMIPFYEHLGPIDVLPIGVDTEVFRPHDKAAMRAKHGIPGGKRVGLWAGTLHPMKGFLELFEYREAHPEIHWIIVWKQEGEDGYLPGAHNFVHVDQQTLAELMSCADFFLCSGKLRPFFMIEWEAMACDLPMTILNDMEKDFVPSAHPREDIFRLGWDRKTTIRTWERYILSTMGD